MEFLAAQLLRLGFVFYLLWAQALSCYAQNPSASDRIGFVNHLTINEYYDEAVHELHSLEGLNLSSAERDSVHFLLGWNHHLAKQLDASTLYFLKVPRSAGFYHKSHFLAGINLCYLNEYSEAARVFGAIATNDPKFEGLANLERAGTALLADDFATFDSLATNFEGSHFAFASEEQKLLGLRQELAGVKRKSPFVAGALSAIIPGSGKVYAGKLHEGVFSFLFVGVLAGATYEQFRHGGFENPQFYLIGSLFSLFYIGNIYGSVFSVKVKRQEQYDALKTQVLFNLHVPLRTVFQ